MSNQVIEIGEKYKNWREFDRKGRSKMVIDLMQITGMKRAVINRKLKLDMEPEEIVRKGRGKPGELINIPERPRDDFPPDEVMLSIARSLPAKLRLFCGVA